MGVAPSACCQEQASGEGGSDYGATWKCPDFLFGIRTSGASIAGEAAADAAGNSGAEPMTEVQSASEKYGVHVYPLGELSFATGDFAALNHLTDDTFGQRFKGFVLDPTLPQQKKGLEEVRIPVVVHKLRPELVWDDERWLEEASAFPKLEHSSLLRCVGIGHAPGTGCIVSEFLPNTTTLEDKIFGKSSRITWDQRISIAKQMTKGLAFLHSMGTLHRQLLPSSVILTESLDVKLAFSGLAKLESVKDPEAKGDHGEAYANMVRMGFVDPEYRETGEWTDKSDVFTLGMLLLEMLTGRRCVNEKGQSFLPWIRVYAGQKKPELKNLVDPRLLKEGYQQAGARKLLIIARTCVEKAELRPAAESVSAQLKLVDLLAT